MRRFDTIATRTMALLLVGLGLFHALSVWAYQASINREIDANNEMRVAERLIAIRRSLATQPADKRELLAHEMSGGPIDAHFGNRPLAVARANDAPAASLRARLIALETELTNAGIVVGSDTGTGDGHHIDNTHQIVVSLGLNDGSFVNVSVVKARYAPAAAHAEIWSTSLMALGVILASLVLVRWITRPLRALGAAARTIEQSPHTERLAFAPIVETGPREVAETARAFNDMQRRIATLLEDRTLSLAAISHDLKTPLTRLRLNIEDVAPPDLQARLAAEIVEMEAMIDGTLTFLRGAPADEAPRLFDVSAIVDTICGDLADQGHDVRVDGARHTITIGHPLQIKRALTNLIQNAVRHGGSTHVHLALQPDGIEITIADDGPGISADQLELAKRPFQRLDASRAGSNVAGAGLGLAIADRIIATQGGTLTLTNRQPHGLEARVRLAKQSSSNASLLSP